MKKILFLLVSLFILVSCNQEVNIDLGPNKYGDTPNTATYVEPGTTKNGEYAITISSYSDGTKSRVMSPRRAHSVGPNYEQLYNNFKLYSWSDLSIIMNPYSVVANNGHWCYVGVDNQDTLYYNKYSNYYNFIGIMADNDATVTGLTSNDDNSTIKASNVNAFKSVNVGGQTSEATPKEFLYAQTKVEKANYGNSANLNFIHGNAKLMFKFKSDRSDTELLDFTPYNPGSPEVPAVPSTQTTTTKTGKALDMLYAGEIVYWPYAGDANLTSTQANNFYKNTSNYGNMGSLMDVVNAQFVYYNTSGNVTTNAWIEGSGKKDMYGIQLAASTNKDDFVGGATEDTWKDAFWINASTQIKDIFRASYAAGWRVIRIEHMSGTQYDAWLLNNTEMTYKVITTTGGTPYQPAVPASGIKGFIVLPATTVSGDATDAQLNHFTTKSDVEIGINNVTWSNQEYVDSIHFDLPQTKVLSSLQWSPTVYYTLPYKTNNYGITVKVSYKYNGVNYYDNRIFIPLANGFEEGKYYTFTININGANGETDPENTDENDPKIKQNNGIHFNVNISDYDEGSDIEVNILNS